MLEQPLPQERKLLLPTVFGKTIRARESLSNTVREFRSELTLPFRYRSGLCGLLCFGLGLYTIFGKRRVETLRTIRIKEALFGICLIILIATLIPATLFAAQRSGVITAPGIPPALILQLVKAAGQKLACEFPESVLLFCSLY